MRFSRIKTLKRTFYLLRRNIVGLSSHIDLLIMVNTRYDEEHSRTSCSTLEKSTKTEDDSSLVFLGKQDDDFHDVDDVDD